MMTPITYVEKGYGLHEAVRAAGHRMEEVNGQWMADDPVAVQAIIDGYTLTEAIRCRQSDAEARASSLRSKVMASYSIWEAVSWPLKLQEAKAMKGGGSSGDAHLLSAEAASRGISVAALIAKVEGNAAQFMALESSISGACGRHKDALALLTTFDAVTAYDLTAGWPEV